jgi:eukaryotic-like serine/threonine-protein kinase
VLPCAMPRPNGNYEMAAAHEERVVRARARVGIVLNDKYRLDRVLGVGGMAAVYAATHLRNASRVAVKLLHPEMAVDTNVRARFLREGYAANSVEHPGTVRILDDDTAEDGSVFLVMELLEGETLDQRWERSGHRLGAREVARLVYQVLDVLAAAHAKRVVHRDVKPENLFLTRDGKVKVLDFGVARLIEGAVTATRPGGIVGTPAFMAPEQVLGKTVDPQSDIYSVGATAFALLSKRYVHDAENAAEMMVIVGSRPARSLALVSPDLPAPLTAVIDRALRFDKADRWPDARAMQAALAKAYREAFSAPMPGTDEAEDETSIAIPTSGGAPSGSGPVAGTNRARRSDRASSAVTVLTGATPVITQAIERGAPQAATTRARWRRLRPSLVAVMGAVLTVAVGVILAMTGGTSATSQAGSQPTSARAAAPPEHPSEVASAWTAPADGIPQAAPPSFNVESLPTAAHHVTAPPSDPQPVAAPPVVAAPPRPAAAPARSTGCTPPFTVDPATGKKKWKLECL